MDGEGINLVELMRRFSTEEDARAYLEALRWPDGPVCPRCGSVKGAYKLTPKATSKKPGRAGLYKCRDKDCRSQFTVTVGTIFEDSHIPLSKWVLTIHLMCASKKGISAHQIHRMLDVTYKTAWFMCHRIRYAMSEEPLRSKLSGIVEADETYVGGKTRAYAKGRSTKKKVPVVALVERGGRVKSRPVKRVTTANLNRAFHDYVEPGTRIMTDEWPAYQNLDIAFQNRETVRHGANEYVRGEAHVNTAEGYFSLLKRGIVGTYHHVSPQHLHRYCDEFDFRYNGRKVEDGVRAVLAVKGAEGKRLMYRDPTANGRAV